MRLFLALNLSPAAKRRIEGEVIQGLAALSEKGSFTRRENLHLTLAFIGETDREADVIAAAKEAEGEPFPLVFSGLGRFRREGGDLYWMGVSESAALSALHISLVGALRARGFSIEERRFQPHLTLGRRVTLKNGADLEALRETIPVLEETFDCLSVMESMRLNGALTYRERHRRTLYDRNKNMF